MVSGPTFGPPMTKIKGGTCPACEPFHQFFAPQSVGHPIEHANSRPAPCHDPAGSIGHAEASVLPLPQDEVRARFQVGVKAAPKQPDLSPAKRSHVSRAHGYPSGGYMSPLTVDKKQAGKHVPGRPSVGTGYHDATGIIEIRFQPFQVLLSRNLQLNHASRSHLPDCLPPAFQGSDFRFTADQRPIGSFLHRPNQACGRARTYST